MNCVMGLSFVPPEGRRLIWSPWEGCEDGTAFLPIIDVLTGLLIPQPSTARCFRHVPVGNRVEMCKCSEITVSEIAMLVYNSSNNEIIDLNKPSKKMCLEIGNNNDAILSPDCKTKYKLQPRMVCKRLLKFV